MRSKKNWKKRGPKKLIKNGGSKKNWKKMGSKIDKKLIKNWCIKIYTSCINYGLSDSIPEELRQKTIARMKLRFCKNILTMFPLCIEGFIPRRTQTINRERTIVSFCKNILTMFPLCIEGFIPRRTQKQRSDRRTKEKSLLFFIVITPLGLRSSQSQRDYAYKI